MFGTNEIVGQKWFREKDEATDGKLFVTSIFYTLQGEGPYAGQPAVFIRLAKCNLNCSFCDTFFDDGDWMTTYEVVTKIIEAIAEFHELDETGLGSYPDENNDRDKIFEIMKNCVLVCTGGEPMLQENLGPFLQAVEDIFMETQIESNGLIWQEIPESTTLVVSPKCSEKAHRYLKPNDKILQRADCFKFVIEADEDSPYNTVPLWAFQTGQPIYVSPMNVYNDVPKESKKLRLNSNMTTLEQRSEIDEVVSFWEDGLLDREANERNHKYAARYAMENGLKLNLQIHLYAGLA